MQDWIVWNCKDKYRQAGSRVGSPGDGVDNACRFARPEVRSLETVMSGSSVVGDSDPKWSCGCAMRIAIIHDRIACSGSIALPVGSGVPQAAHGLASRLIFA
jgi:hypothetical protein